MLKNKTDFWGLSSLKSLKVMITVALFSAISFLFGKFLAIPVGDYMRFSFENLPIILSGIMFGPFTGALCGIAADIIGCILRGYAINPILTLGAAIIGFVSGFLYKLSYKCRLSVKLALSVFVSHIIGSVIIKTIGLSIWYSSPFLVTLGWRTINYVVVSLAEFIVLAIILRNRGFKRQIMRISGDSNEL